MSKTWQRARRPEQKEERKSAILAAAAQLLEQDGLAGTGINAIARLSGISKPNIYRYFESSEAVLMQLLLDQHRSWARAFTRRLKQLDKGADTDAIAAALVDTIARRPAYSVLLGAVASVLEHNVGVETIIDYKRELRVENQPVLAAFIEVMPGDLTRERALNALAGLLMAASGMWSHCNPAPVTREALAQPDLKPLRFQFKSLFRDHAAALLRGLAIEAEQQHQQESGDPG
ncbi:MAG: TetR family transcriptional regulator [Myxococcota bacterium]